MARNKHPEVTVRRILDAAQRLFLSRGYERTSIQDIIDGLDGLSRGAIYHHFKSKEDILIAVTERLNDSYHQLLTELRDRTDLTGREKLAAIFRTALQRPEQETLFSFAPPIGRSPQLLSSLLHSIPEDAAPNYLAPILRQGVADGSLDIENPDEVAELLLIVTDIWMSSLVFGDDAGKSRRKFQVCARMFRGFGLDVTDDELMERWEHLSGIFDKNK